ncbi:sialin-like isoform X1 [Clytia hemisphaerica]
MVNQTYANAKKTSLRECETGNTTIAITQEDGEFLWDQNRQGLILGAFFYGYLITQVPGGWLANRYGGKWVYAVGMLFCNIMTALTPVAARTSYMFLIAARVIEGLGQGVAFPAAHSMIAKWSPENERSRYTVISFAGMFTGTILTYPLAGILAESSFLGGWPSIFYLCAIISFVWLFLWIFLVHDSPSQHPTISQEEKTMIETSVKKATDADKNLVYPWRAIFSSIHVWAIIITHICKNWVWYMVLTGLPSYFKNVLNFDIKKNGFLSALPYIAGMIFQFVGGFLADFLQNNKLSKQTTKRIMTVFGFYPTAVLLLLTSYTKCDEVYLSVTYMVIATGLLSLNNSGYNINHLDLAPRYSGILYGIENLAGTIPGGVAPAITGYLTNDDPSRENYRKVFAIAASLAAFGGTFFIIFCSGEKQSWNDPENHGMSPEEKLKEANKKEMHGITNEVYAMDATNL